MDLPNEIRQIHREYLGTDEIDGKSLRLLAHALSSAVGRSNPWTGNMVLSHLKRHKGFDGDNKQLRQAIKRLRGSMAHTTPVSIVEREIVSQFDMPSEIIVDIEPRQCACGQWFIPKTWNHKKCNRRCKSNAASKPE